MDLISYFFNFIPLWVWITIAVVALALTFQFWAPIWAILPRWVKVTLAAIGAGFGLYAAGRYKGAKDERDQRAKANARALQTKNEVSREVDQMDKPTRDRELKRWMRD